MLETNETQSAFPFGRRLERDILIVDICDCLDEIMAEQTSVPPNGKSNNWIIGNGVLSSSLEKGNCGGHHFRITAIGIGRAFKTYLS